MNLKKKISAYIPYEEVPASGLDRVTNWVAQEIARKQIIKHP